jgi:hypothetical protein
MSNYTESKYKTAIEQGVAEELKANTLYQRLLSDRGHQENAVTVNHNSVIAQREIAIEAYANAVLGGMRDAELAAVVDTLKARFEQVRQSADKHQRILDELNKRISNFETDTRDKYADVYSNADALFTDPYSELPF